MKTKLMFLICVLPVIAAEPDGYKYWSSAELKGFSKTLSARIDSQKTNAPKIATDRLAELGNHYALVAHREGSGEAELHETEADLLVIQSGSATLIVGGAVQSRRTTAPGEIRGPSIDGGSKQKLAAGDVVHIPSKTAHQMLLEHGAQVTYFILKVKE